MEIGRDIMMLSLRFSCRMMRQQQRCQREDHSDGANTEVSNSEVLDAKVLSMLAEVSERNFARHHDVVHRNDATKNPQDNRGHHPVP